MFMEVLIFIQNNNKVEILVLSVAHMLQLIRNFCVLAQRAD